MHDIPAKVLGTILKISSDQGWDEFGPAMNRLLQIFSSRQTQIPVAFLLSEFQFGPYRSPVVFREVPPFPLPIQLGDVRVYVDAARQSATPNGSSPRRVSGSQQAKSVFLELNKGTFVHLLDREDHIEARFQHEQDTTLTRLVHQDMPRTFQQRRTSCRSRAAGSH